MDSKADEQDVLSIMDDLGLATGEVTTNHVKRAPNEFQKTQYEHLTSSGASIDWGGDVEVRLKKNQLLGQEYWVELVLAAAATTANPGFVPTYHMFRDVELRYGQKFVERWLPHQLWYENTQFVDNNEVLQIQSSHNDGAYTSTGTNAPPTVAATNQAVVNNARTGQRYYLKIPFVHEKFIHFPTSTYNSEWSFQFRLNNLNQVIVGTDGTAGTGGGFSSFKIIQVGMGTDPKFRADAKKMITRGLSMKYDYPRPIPLGNLVRGNSDGTELQFRFEQTRSRVSTVVFWGIQSAAYTSTTPNTINRNGFVDFSNILSTTQQAASFFSFGTEANKLLYTQNRIPLRHLLLANQPNMQKGFMKQLLLEPTAIGNAGVENGFTITTQDRMLPIFVWQFNESHFLSTLNGNDTGSAFFDGQQLITLDLPVALDSNIGNVQFIFLFYDQKMMRINQANVTTSFRGMSGK